MNYSIVESDLSDARLIGCAELIASHVLTRAVELNENALFSFPHAPFVSSYLEDTLRGLSASHHPESEFNDVVNITLPPGSKQCLDVDIFNHAKTLLDLKCKPSPISRGLSTGWARSAVIAHGSKSMIAIASCCCADEMQSMQVDDFICDLQDCTALPVFVNPWNFTTSVIDGDSLNSVKAFAALVSMCFFYAGMNCIHSHIAALLGIPTFILQENIADNRSSVSGTLKMHRSAKFLGGDKHGGSFISEARKSWQRLESRGG